MMLARFSSAHDQFATKEFLVVQFSHGALCFIDCQHLNEGKSLGTLVMFVGYDFSVLDGTDPVEELEEVAFRCIE